MIAFRNLLRSKARTVMTVIGTACAISLYISIEAITESVRQQTREAAAIYNDRFTVQKKGALSPMISRISAADVRKLERLAGTENVIPVVLGYVRLQSGHQVIAVGTNRAGLELFPILEGRGIGSHENEAIVGIVTAKRLGIKRDEVLNLGDGDVAVRGIYSIGSRFIDSGILMKLGSAARVLDRGDSVNLAIVRVNSSKDVSAAVDRINRDIPGLQAMSGQDLIGNIRMFRAADTFARAISLIALIVSCIIIANTLLMAVMERTREIGILMTIGWKLALIWRMLAAEAIILCVSGALVGNCMALLILETLNRSQAIGLGWIPLSAPWTTVAQSLGVSLLIGLLSSVYPGIVAARLSPIDALRHE